MLAHMVQKLIVTIFLFFIGALHTMIFSFFQFPGTFVADDLAQDPIASKFVLYFFSIAVSCFHRPIVKRIGLKKTLSYGLIGDAIGLFMLYLQHFHDPSTRYVTLFLATALLGAANLSVINSLLTYIILEFPKKTIAAITGLFASLNLGIMSTPLALKMVDVRGIEWHFFFFLVALLIAAVLSIRFFFTDPIFDKSLEHLRSGSELWREMHRRLALYVLAIILYAWIESTFSLWGSVQLFNHLPRLIAESASSVFWIFMIIGQLVLLVPLYYFQPRKFFYFLIPLMLVALIYIPNQTELWNISFGLAMGGISCAVVFPIFLSLMEMEIIQGSMMSHHSHYLPLVDTAVSFLMAGYLLGASAIDLWISLRPEQSAAPFFRFAIIILGIVTALMIYLNRTRTDFINPAGK